MLRVTGVSPIDASVGNQGYFPQCAYLTIMKCKMTDKCVQHGMTEGREDMPESLVWQLTFHFFRRHSFKSLKYSLLAVSNGF